MLASSGHKSKSIICDREQILLLHSAVLGRGSSFKTSTPYAERSAIRQPVYPQTVLQFHVLDAALSESDRRRWVVNLIPTF
eukprot:5959736-Pleurochrysis_carterae.AAC.2